MGFPTEFKIKDIGVSDTQLYRQFGNSVAVPVVRTVSKAMIEFIIRYSREKQGKIEKKTEKQLKEQTVTNMI